MSKLIEFNGKPLRIDPQDNTHLQIFAGGAWSVYSLLTECFEDIMNYGNEIMAIGKNGRTYISSCSGRSWVPRS